MMNKVVLINPLWVTKKRDIQDKVKSCFPPLGLACLASFLRQSGIRVRIIDANAENLSNFEIIERLKPISPAFIGLTATTAIINSALNLAKEIKATFPSSKIIFGGIHTTAEPDSILSNEFVNFVFRGEVEQYLPLLISGASLENIPSLSHKRNNKISHNPVGIPLLDLDSAPIPAWDLLPIHLYKPSLGNYKRLPAIGMVTSRGCPGQCTFCFSGNNNIKTRFRSPQSLIEEIEFLQERFGIKEISFYDDNFTLNKNFIFEFCNLLFERKIDLTWTCSSRIDTVNEAVLRTMKKSGCHQISFGIESADKQILKNIKKNINLDIAREVIKTTRKVGIEAKIFLMFGSPGETQKTLRKTLDFALNSFSDGFIVSITTPYPGTELYRWAQEKGYLCTKNWDDYDTTKPIIKLPTIDTNCLMTFYSHAYKELYLRPNFLFDKLIKIRSFDDLRKNILAFRAIIRI